MYLKFLNLRNCLLYCTVYTGTCIHVHIKKLNLRVAMVANMSTTASMLGVSCQIGGCIAHSRRFSSIEVLNAV